MEMLFTSSDLKASAEEFLIYGIESESARLHKETADNLVSQWNSINDENAQFQDSLRRYLRDAEICRESLQRCDILGLFKEYAKKQAEIQLILVSTALTKLRDYKSVLQIPSLVLQVFHNIPKHIPSESKLLKILSNTVGTLRQNLLNEFHEKFEKHMSESEDEDSVDPQRAWVVFLSAARDWLLAYTMVSLLPYTLTDTTLLMEKYQETLDAVFTPMWGKFHFHLSAGRAAGSSQQLMWTFHYAKNFYHLLTGLCTEITASTELKQLHAANYKAAGLQYVTNKVARFMRAHIAQAMVKHSPLSDKLCVELVEAALELDETLTEKCAPDLTITAVVTDARPVLLQWLAADRDYFATSVVAACSDCDVVFQCKFTSISSRADWSCYETESSTEAHSGRQTRCFAALYDCLCLAVLSMQRYAHLPVQAQNLFSEVIIEPLLIVSLGILLLRVRSSAALIDMGRGMLPEGQMSRPNEMTMVIDSALYLQSVLEPSSLPSLAARAGRFDARWKKIRVWVSEAAAAGVSLRALPEYVMGSCELDEKSVSMGAVAETGKLSTAISLLRNQAVSLCDALDEQYHEALQRRRKAL